MESLIEAVDTVLATCSLDSKAALARRFGVSRKRLHEWLAGNRQMPTRHVKRLAQMARIKPADLVGRYQIERLNRKARSR